MHLFVIFRLEIRTKNWLPQFYHSFLFLNFHILLFCTPKWAQDYWRIRILISFFCFSLLSPLFLLLSFSSSFPFSHFVVSYCHSSFPVFVPPSLFIIPILHSSLSRPRVKFSNFPTWQWSEKRIKTTWKALSRSIPNLNLIWTKACLSNNYPSHWAQSRPIR